MSGSKRSKRTPRPYIKIDTSIADHRKALELDELHYLGALGLFMLGLCHSDRLRTDGLVTDKMLRRIAPGYEPLRDELVRVGFWVADHDGYRPPNYARWQDTADEIEAKSDQGRSAARARWNPEASADRNTDGNADRNASGNAPNLTQPNPPNPPILPNPADESVTLSWASDGRLSAPEAGELLIEYPFGVLLESIEDTKKLQTKGRLRKSFAGCVEGTARNKCRELRAVQ